MSILQPFSALEKAIKNRKSRKEIFNIEFINNKKIEQAKNELTDFTSSQYQNWKAISDGTQDAKSSFDAYVASCISGRKKLSAEGYKDFLNQNIGQYSSGKGGAQQILDQYKELGNAVAEAEAKVSKSQLAIGTFIDPDIDDSGYIQVKKSLKENEDALQKAKKAYEDFDTAVAAGNPDLAEFAKQGNLGAGAGKKFEKTSKSVAAAERARAAGHALANAALSFGLSVLLQVISTGLMALINADKEAIEKANELGEEYKKTNEEISDHAEKIKELKDTIASGTLTEAESYDKKKELLEIQNELYDAYGKQAEGIDLVNGKYDEEIAKLREINKQKAQEALNNGGYAGEESAKKIINKKHSISLNTGIYTDRTTDVYKGILERSKELGATFDQYSHGYIFKNKTTEEALIIYDNLIEYINENFNGQDKDVQKWLSALSEQRGKLNSEEYNNAQKALEDTALQRIAANDEAYEYYNQIQQAIADYI